MDDMTRFERQLADELDDMAGHGRDVDAMAVTRAASARHPRSTSRSPFSATRIVLAGSLAALVLAFLVLGRPLPPPAHETIPVGASASPSAPATVLPGLVSEQVEPGVLRIIRDDAGHDLDERHPNWRYDLDDMAITPDGTVWLSVTNHDSDNVGAMAHTPLVFALRRPGAFGTGDGIPPDVGRLVPLADDSVLAVGEEVVRVTETGVTPDAGPPVRPVYGGTLWLITPEALAAALDGGSPGRSFEAIWDGQAWDRLAETGRTVRSPTDRCEVVVHAVACQSGRYLRGTPINRLAVAPDGAIWAVGGFEDEGGGLYRISPP